MVSWSDEDGHAAAAEGWGIFAVMGGSYGSYQLQCLDEGDTLSTDEEAMRLVFSNDTLLHVHARAAIRELNPLEWFMIMRYVTNHVPELLRDSLVKEHCLMLLKHGDIPDPG